jgi:4'-phosphopantetheinyl transferase
VDEVHLWLAFEQETQSPALLTRYREMVPAEERASTDRFHFESGRRQHLITRALVRTVLSRYCEVPVEDWQFVRDAHGRPHVAADQRVPGLPAFNLSHTRGLIACAVTGAPAVGVDVEHVSARRSSLDIADRYFAAAESAALRALPPEEHTDRFFHYWTLKESYIKARGKGLSIPLADFAFAFAGDRGLSVSFDGSLGEEATNAPAGWQFWLCRPSPEHVAAICVTTEPGAHARLTARRIVPLHSDEPFPCEVLRASAE